MQYVAALYDHLVRGKAIDLADGLPPVLPIVIYNGDTRWKHSPEIFDLIQPHPAVLSEFQPKLKFWLLDEGKFSPAYLEGLQRVMAAIFRMEHAHDTTTVKQSIRYLGQAVAQSPLKQAIDKAVLQWAQCNLLKKFPGLKLPDTLLEGTEMLEENLDRIYRNAVAEGVVLGKLEGKLEGESALLERQIAKRFGPLTDNTRIRLNTATTEQLETWAERILDAGTLAEVFGDH